MRRNPERSVRKKRWLPQRGQRTCVSLPGTIGPIFIPPTHLPLERIARSNRARGLIFPMRRLPSGKTNCVQIVLSLSAFSISGSFPGTIFHLIETTGGLACKRNLRQPPARSGELSTIAILQTDVRRTGIETSLPTAGSDPSAQSHVIQSKARCSAGVVTEGTQQNPVVAAFGMPPTNSLVLKKALFPSALPGIDSTAGNLRGRQCCGRAAPQPP